MARTPKTPDDSKPRKAATAARVPGKAATLRTARPAAAKAPARKPAAGAAKPAREAAVPKAARAVAASKTAAGNASAGKAGASRSAAPGKPVRSSTAKPTRATSGKPAAPKKPARSSTAKPAARAPRSTPTGTAKAPARASATRPATRPAAKPAPARTARAAAPKPASARPAAKKPAATPAPKPARTTAAKAAAPRPVRKKLAPPEIDRLVQAAVASLEDDKAEDIVVLDVATRATFADRMVIATGLVERQIQAMATHVDKALGELGIKRIRVESSPDWVLLDAGDLVVHLFRPEARANYRLEKMWGPDSPLDADTPAAAAENTVHDPINEEEDGDAFEDEVIEPYLDDEEEQG
jgi:ribosome silencing factor RsfS/YbeB/iojap